jgi:hypothetical protein
MDWEDKLRIAVDHFYPDGKSGARGSAKIEDDDVSGMVFDDTVEPRSYIVPLDDKSPWYEQLDPSRFVSSEILVRPKILKALSIHLDKILMRILHREFM